MLFPGLLIFPVICKHPVSICNFWEGIVPIPTLPLNVVIPDTFNDDMHVVALFNVVFPEIFNVDKNVEGLLKPTIEGGLILHYNLN